MWDDLKIANAALGSFGSGAITSFDQALPPAPRVKMKYHEVIDGLLSEYPWNFSKRTVKLQRLRGIGGPINFADDDQSSESFPPFPPFPSREFRDDFLASGWRFAFQLPNDIVAPPDKYLVHPRRADHPLRHFEVQNQTLYCDREEVWAVARCRVDVANWPPYFVTAAIACLAAELIMPVSGNAGILQIKQEEAWGTPDEFRRGGKLGLAKLADSRTNSSPAMLDNPLINARWT
jgi:hypothetical protein